MTSQSSILQHFTTEVMYNAALFDLPKVTNDKGEIHVVACLDEEPLSVVLDRVAASGGYATVFSRSVTREDGTYTVRATEFIDERCAIENGAERMTNEEAPSPHAPFGLFLDYLQHAPNGVVIPATLGSKAEATSTSRQVEFQPI